MLARDISIGNVSVIDVKTGNVEVRDLQIERGIIMESGASSTRSDMVAIDGRGKFAIPGMIDCHVHLNWDGGQDPWSTLDREGINIALLRVYRNAMVSLQKGVTTLRDTGSRDDVAIDVAKTISGGILSGPQILAAGRIIAITGGHTAGLGYEVDGPLEALKAVRTLIKKGADFIKIAATSGAYGETGAEKLESYQLNEDEISIVTKEAHKYKLRVAAHALNSTGIQNALRNGVDTIEHGAFLDEQGAKMMREKDASLIPTLLVYRKMAEGGEEIMRQAVEKSKLVVEHHREAIRLAMKYGVRVAAGTDAGSPNLGDHPSLQDEAVVMRECGMSTSDVLRALTINAAEAVGIESTTGSIEVKKKADVVLLDANPLEDLRNLRKVSSVIKDGRIVQPFNW